MGTYYTPATAIKIGPVQCTISFLLLRDTCRSLPVHVLLYLGYTLVYRGYHPLRNGDSYQYGMTQVPTWLPVRVYWDEPRRSTYHFTSSIRNRLARPRCRGNRHGLQPAARPGLIERACSKTAGGRRLGHFSRTAFVTSTSRFGVVSSSRSLLHASDAAQVARGGQCRSRCSRCGPFGPFARPRAAPGGR